MGIVMGVIREEMPQFTLIHKAATYEVRKYAPSVIAETSFGTGGWGGGSDGKPFGALARYIGVFGTPMNAATGKPEAIAMTAPVLVTAPEPVAMTAPVLVSPTSTQHTMAFVLPASRYKTVDEAPKPTDPRVHLRQLPERLQAVRQYSWTFSPGVARGGPKQRSVPRRAPPLWTHVGLLFACGYRERQEEPCLAARRSECGRVASAQGREWRRGLAGCWVQSAIYLAVHEA